MKYGYDTRSNSAVIFCADTFHAVETFDVKQFKDCWHMYSHVTRRVDELSKGEANEQS